MTFAQEDKQQITQVRHRTTERNGALSMFVIIIVVNTQCHVVIVDTQCHVVIVDAQFSEY